MSSAPPLTTASAAPRPARAVIPAAPILVIGAGSIGQRHVANLRSLGVPVSVLRTTERPVELDADVTVERDLQVALKRRPQAVFVCNPTALHVPVALAAARAGCDLLVEKPLAEGLDGVKELSAEVAWRGSVAVVGYQFRFHPTLARVKGWIEEAALGEIVSARVHWGEHLPSWHPGEDYRRGYSARRELGGGAVLTLSHPFDYLRWLLGDVEWVSAEVAQRGGFRIDVEDTALAHLRFASGALASVSLDYVERPPSHRLHLVGRKAVVEWDGLAGRASLRRGDGEVDHAEPPEGFRRNDLFLAETRHFLACIDGRESPRCTLADGTAALRIALAARTSADEGRRVHV